MVERLLFVLALTGLLLGVALVVRGWVRRRSAAAIGTLAPTSLRARLAKNGPTLVYFYGPHCGSCAEQARALEELAGEGRATVVSLDATRERDLADSLGVATIPTTAVLDAGGRVRWVNLGYQPKGALALQLAGL